MELVVNNLSYLVKRVNFKDTYLFENLSVSFEESKIHGIVGKSGSGKTIFLDLLAFERKTIENEIFITDVFSHEYKRYIGYLSELPEERFIFNTVEEEMINSIYMFKKMDILEFKKRISDSLKLVGLNDEYLKYNINSLSIIDKRKIALAIMLFHNPKIIILDDPFRGLNLASKKELILFFKMLKNRYKKTIIIASNDTDSILKVCDLVYVLGNKNIVLQGSKYKVFTNFKLLKKYNIKIPNTILFSKCVLEKKNIRIGYRDEINDLIKDIYRNVKW